MAQYFAYEYHGEPFVLFGGWHLVALAVIALLNLYLLGFRKSSTQTRQTVRQVMLCILWLNQIASQIWYAYWGHWSIQTMLPLHLCTLMVWLAGFMLLFKSYRIYEFVYFLGIGGACMALLTPDAGIYGFPHFRFIQTILSHGLLLTAAVYMTAVEGFRPTRKSVRRMALGSAIYLGLVGAVDWAIGSNYCFLAHKPATASLFDLLPPWPWYLIYLGVIGIALCALLYLPFTIRDRRAKVIGVES